MSHNRVRTAEDGQGSAKFEWQNCSPKLVRLESDGKMSTFFPHSEKIV